MNGVVSLNHTFLSMSKQFPYNAVKADVCAQRDVK